MFFPNFPKILSVKSFGMSWGNLNDSKVMSRATCGESNNQTSTINVQNITNVSNINIMNSIKYYKYNCKCPKCYNHGCRSNYGNVRKYENSTQINRQEQSGIKN